MIWLNLKAKKAINIYSLNKQFNILCNLFGQLKDIHIYACCSQDELKKYLGMSEMVFPDWVVGANHKEKIAVLEKAQLDIKGFDMTSICKHEMVHVFINHFVPNCPLWLNEGLAQNLIWDNKNKIKDEKSIEHLSNPYDLSYDSNIYCVSDIVTRKLLKKCGITNVIRQLKTCSNFENDVIFGYSAIDKLILGKFKYKMS